MNRPVSLAAQLALTLLTLVALTGCGGGLGGTGDANYVVEGAVTEIAVEDREGPVDISGETLQGEPISLADLRGEVVVLNLWGSWCGPCHAEAPLLQAASEELDAEFVGLSFRESSFDNARTFERRYAITYPTIADEGDQVLALGRWVPRSPPSTYVLDPEGRIAAVITGEVTSASTLEALVDQAAGGPSDG